jgi:purine-binding chemotaxis protein CheW
LGKFVVFTVSGEEFGIGLDRIFEIIKPQKATPLPGVPNYISGVINLRGAVLPLMDMRKRLNVKPVPKKEKIIIVKMHGEKIGLLVDSVKEILNIEEEQIAPPPSIFKGLKPEYLKGIGKMSERLIIILNLDILLTSEEITLIGDITEKSLSSGQGN